jgi:fatty acid desaturase
LAVIEQRLIAECLTVPAGHLIALSLAIGCRGIVSGTVLYVLIVGLPTSLASGMMMFTNYLQHVGCDSGSASAHSRNFTSSVWNWFVFDNGFHTVHHEHPGAHWSELRALHARRQASIDPVLDQGTPLEFVCARYIARQALPERS